MDTTASLLVSILALAVSVWTGIRTTRIGQGQRRVQERLLSLESAREKARQALASSARLRGDIQRTASSAHLVIHNEGSSEARAIEVLLDGNPLHKHARVIAKEQELARVLGPGASVRYILAITMGAPPLIAIDISWEDDRGQRVRWRSDLRWQ